MRELIILAHVLTDSVNGGFIPAAQRLGLSIVLLTDHAEAHRQHFNQTGLPGYPGEIIACDVFNPLAVIDTITCRPQTPAAIFSNSDHLQDREGVDNLDAILSVAGIDMVLEGAIDLSQSYGVPGQAQHPIVQDAVEKIAATCRHRNIPFCAIPRAPDQAAAWKECEVQAYLLWDDRGVSFRAIKAHLMTFRS